MLRISGVVLPGNKQIVVALTYVKGIGRSLAKSIVDELHINPVTKADDITEEEQSKIRTRVEKELTEGELSRKVGLDIKRLQDIGTWRGMRHRKKLPVRGQSSKRNARTKRGKKKTGLSGRTVLTKT